MHDFPRPQAVPRALLVDSMQTFVPVVQEFEPFLHGLAAVQGSPAVQESQEPLKQTEFVPQLVPLSAGAPVSLQTGAPVAHDCVPL